MKKELNKELTLDESALETALEDIASREELICKGYACGADITII